MNMPADAWAAVGTFAAAAVALWLGLVDARRTEHRAAKAAEEEFRRQAEKVSAWGERRIGPAGSQSGATYVVVVWNASDAQIRGAAVKYQLWTRTPDGSPLDPAADHSATVGMIPPQSRLEIEVDPAYALYIEDTQRFNWVTIVFSDARDAIWRLDGDGLALIRRATTASRDAQGIAVPIAHVIGANQGMASWPRESVERRFERNFREQMRKSAPTFSDAEEGAITISYRDEYGGIHGPMSLAALWPAGDDALRHRPELD